MQSRWQNTHSMLLNTFSKSLVIVPLLLLIVTFSTAQVAASAESIAQIPLQQGVQVGASYFAEGDTPQGGHGQPIDGIEGASNEMLKNHVHVHLSIFYKGHQIAIPYGIGIIKPFRVVNGFVESGKGYYWLHTHDASGIVHIESPKDETYALGNFFDIWGQQLGTHNVAGFKGTLRTYVDGKFYFGDIRKIALKEHTQIILAVDSPLVFPINYIFPDGL